jgi:drug/metabolite transporter (DMT)-like permease
MSGSNSRGQGVLKYELLLLLVSMIWGSAFVAQQIGMEKGLGPMTFNGLRFALGCHPDLPHWLLSAERYRKFRGLQGRLADLDLRRAVGGSHSGH